MPFWKLGVLGKIQKILKTANYNLDFFGQIQFQIIATGKPFEINGWNQFQMITLELKFGRKKFTQCREKAMDFSGGRKSKIRRSCFSWVSELNDYPYKVDSLVDGIIL